MAKFISIDLDSQGIFAVFGSAKSGHAAVELAVAWDGTDGEPPPALTAETAKQIGEQLRERLNSAGVTPSPVLISIPRDRVILKELRYPTVPLTEEPNVVKFQAMKELTDAPEDVVVDYVPLTVGSIDGERRSMAVAVKKDFFNSIQALCTAANLKITAITPRPYGVAAGLHRAFAIGAAPRPEDKNSPVAIVTLGPGGGEFTVIRPGTVAGSGDATFIRTIAPHSMTNEASLLVEVRRNLTMYAGANPENPIQALYIGEPEGRRVNHLKNALGIPVHAYDPLSGVAATIPPDSNRGRFAGAVGLLAAQAFAELPINFVTPRQPKAKGDPKQKQILIGAGVGFLLVVAGLVLGTVAVSAKEKKLADLQKQKQGLEDDVKMLDPDFKRYQAAKLWQSRGVVWLDMLYDVTSQFNHSDGTIATSYIANAIPPDQKTGKQEAQAKFEINLVSHSFEPVNTLMAAMDADNTNPKSKYYIGVDKVVKGSPSNDPNAHEYSITGKVTNRPPDQFNRFAFFSPPSRKGYPPPVAAPVHKETEAKEPENAGGEKAKESDPKQAPSPKTKTVPMTIIIDDM